MKREGLDAVDPTPKRRTAHPPLDLTARDILLTLQSPPPTISLATGQPLHLTAVAAQNWASDAGGKSAARRGPELDELRLIGSVRFIVRTEVPAKQNTDALLHLAPMLGMLMGASKPREANPRWCGSKVKATASMAETWDASTGEIAGQGFVLPSKLLNSLHEGKILCQQEWACEFLEALGALSSPDPTLWGCPLIRAIAMPPAPLIEPVGAQGAGMSSNSRGKRRHSVQQVEVDHSPSQTHEGLSGGRGGASAECIYEACDGELGITVHVYISRLLLYLIAHPAIKLIMNRVQLPHAAADSRLALDSVPIYPQAFMSHGGAAAPPFSLEGVLKAAEHTGHRVADQPSGIALPLMFYQLQAVAWCSHRLYYLFCLLLATHSPPYNHRPSALHGRAFPGCLTWNPFREASTASSGNAEASLTTTTSTTLHS